MSAETRKMDAAGNGIVDVSELPADRVRQYARSSGSVYFERKGGRTFLVTE